MTCSYRKAMDFLFFRKKRKKKQIFSHARARAGLICMKTGVYFIVNKNGNFYRKEEFHE